MKKLFILFALLITIPGWANENTVPADTITTAGAERPKRDNYVGIRLHKNEHIDFDYENRAGRHLELLDDTFGGGIVIGNRLSDHVKLEFETSYTSAQFNFTNETDTHKLWSNMLNMYLFQEFSGAVAPYAGVGVGVTGIWSNMDAHAAGVQIKDTAFDMSWQLMLGINFALNDRIDLNLGVKYQKYGTIEHTNSNVVISTTDIDATEFYISGVYKFGL